MPQQQPQRSEEKEKPRGCRQIAGAAAGLLLLLLLLAVTWGQIDGSANAASSIARSSPLRFFFRRPIVSHEEQEGGYDAGFGIGRRRDEPSSLRRRPGMDRPGDDAVDVLWRLEPQCVATLYHGTGNDTCGCSIMNHHDSPAAAGGAGAEPAALAFVDGEGDDAPSLLLPAGGTARFTLQSTHACSDVVDAAFYTPAGYNALHANVMVPARVLALDKRGGYEVSTTLPYAGTYTLKVGATEKADSSTRKVLLGVFVRTHSSNQIDKPSDTCMHTCRHGSCGKASPPASRAERAPVAAASSRSPPDTLPEP